MGPTEKIVRNALEIAGVEFTYHGHHKGRVADEEQKALDFFLYKEKVYIECKEFHSPRISGQMARAPNVIAIQGQKAALLFAKLITGQYSSTVEPSAHNALVSGSNPDAVTNPASSNGRTAHFDCANRGSNP